MWRRLIWTAKNATWALYLALDRLEMWAEDRERAPGAGALWRLQTER